MSERTFKFLIVDDMDDIIELLEMFLEKQFNCVVHQAEDEKVARKMYQKEKYDLIFLDYILENFEGSELAHEIRTNSPLNQHTPIIMLTSYYHKAKEKLKDLPQSRVINKFQIFKDLYEEINLSLSKGNILILEDNDSLAEMLKLGIEMKLKYSVDTENNGSDGLVKCTKRQYSFIFCDINMPIMGGDKFIELLRENEGPNRETPIVVISTEFPRNRKIGDDGVYFLQKPIRIDDLTDLVKKFQAML